MKKTLLLFEDESARWFEPVALTRSVASLRVGAWTHGERWSRLFPDRDVALSCREALAPVERQSSSWASVNESPSGDVLFVASALGAPSLSILEAIRYLEPSEALVHEGRFVGARAHGAQATALAGRLLEVCGRELLARTDVDWPSTLEGSGFRIVDGGGPMPRTLADLMLSAPSIIDSDFEAYASLIEPVDSSAYPGVQFVAPDRIRLADKVSLAPGVVIDATEGTVLIGPRTKVGANSVLIGPLVVGPDCSINAVARVGEGTCLGPVCKMGGEVAETIVQGYSNKQHDGFLGHSYLGSWVNLGAATDTSDLKNDYGEVRITLSGEAVSTGSRHVGSLIGDHSKTAIHTRLNTGTVVGVSANVFGAGFPSKEIPSFTWGATGDWHPYRLEKALRVAEIVTSRRDIAFSTAERDLFGQIHRETESQRSRLLGCAPAPTAG